MSFRKRGGETGGHKLTSSTPLINVDLVFQARQILLTQLQDRGFDISNYRDFSTHEIHSMISNASKEDLFNALDMLLELNDPENKSVGFSGASASRVFVKYMLNTTLRDNILNDLIESLYNVNELLSKENGDELILIIPSEPNEKIVKTIEHIYHHDNIMVRIIYMKRLLFDIREHSLVPRHILLSKEQTEDVMKQYNIMHSSQFPEISRFDPVAQAIGMRPGDVCEIIRPSKTAIQSKYYRYCV